MASSDSDSRATSTSRVAVYKVRVGDFVTRADADRALATIRAANYADAWIVPSKVAAARAQTP